MDANGSNTTDSTPSWTLSAIFSQRLLWIGPVFTMVTVLTVVLVQLGIVTLMSDEHYLDNIHLILGLWAFWLIPLLVMAILTLVIIVTILRAPGKLATRLFAAVLFVANSRVSLSTLGILVLWMGSSYTAVMLTTKVLGPDTTQQHLERRWSDGAFSDTPASQSQK